MTPQEKNNWRQEKNLRDDRLNDCFFASSQQEWDENIARRQADFDEERLFAKQRRENMACYILQDVFAKDSTPKNKTGDFVRLHSVCIAKIYLGKSTGMDEGFADDDDFYYLGPDGTIEESILNAQIFQDIAFARIVAKAHHPTAKLEQQTVADAIKTFYQERRADDNHEEYISS